MTGSRSHERRASAPDGLPSDAEQTFNPDRSVTCVGGAGPAGSAGPGRDPGEPAAEGGFRRFRFIERGGFGEVWAATQVSLQRTVALKRLRHDLPHDSEDGRRRIEDFRREALTTAALEHPNIVPVYDAGEDDLGRPLLAMKLVRGRTWKEMIAEDLALEQSEFFDRHLPILIDLAQAVAFAHSRGVMHRDIKPSQVLVGEFGEVVLVDWGLAVRFAEVEDPVDGAGPSEKAHDRDDRDRPACSTLATATCPAGSPAYMAPEQTDETPDRLGPWTDVYLLGSTLYTLLTGTPPRTGVTAEGAFILASLGEFDPPRVRAPDRDFPTDLEELAIRAMEVDRRRRPTATEFIGALQEHLSGAKRRRESDRLVLLVADELPTAGGSYGVLSQCLSKLDRASGLWSDHPRIGDLLEETLCRYCAAATANGDLELARRQARRIADGPRRRGLDREIDRRAGALRRTARQRRFFIAASAFLAAALLASGVKYTIDQKRARDRLAEQRNAAVAAREQAEGFAAFMLEDLTPSLEALGRLDLLDRVARTSISYYAALPSDAREPDSLSRRSLALRNAGRVLRDLGDLENARAAVVESVDVARGLVDRNPDDPAYRSQLADRLLELGFLMAKTSDPDAAIESYSRARALYQSVLAEDPDGIETRRGLARCLTGTGFELWARAELDASLAAVDRAVEILERLVRDHPDDLESRRLLVEAYAQAGGVQRDRGDLEASASMARRGIELGTELVDADPTNTLSLAALSECASSLGFTLWNARDLSGALAAYRTALRIDSRLSERDPTNQDRRHGLAIAHSNVGEMLRGLGRPTEALASLQSSVAILGPLVDDNPDHAEWRYGLAAAYVELGSIHESLGRHGAAERHWTMAADTIRSTALERDDLYYLDTYARALLLLGRVDDAGPIVDRLLAKGWRSSAFLELCRRHGLLPDP